MYLKKKCIFIFGFLLLFVDGVFEGVDVDVLLVQLLAQSLDLRLFDQNEVLESLMFVVRRPESFFRRREMRLEEGEREG